MEEFRSKTEALHYLEVGVERGQYQACGNLELTERMDFRGRTYRPYCREKSLGVHDTYRAVASTYCPEGCHFFLSKEEFAAKQGHVARQQWVANARTSILRASGTVLLAPFRYFQKLPAIVQSLIIILLIVASFPQFKNTIVEILKALKN